VLSEIPDVWERRVRRWQRLNKGLRMSRGKTLAPVPLDEYSIYQALVGAWPHGALSKSTAVRIRERMKAYPVKALREAKQATSWLDPDGDYEQACLGFLEGLLDLGRSPRFLDDLRTFIGEITPFAVRNSLAQTALKLTAPGLPDIYRGTELWDLSLVDPDNRGPVDFELRRPELTQPRPPPHLAAPARR